MINYQESDHFDDGSSSLIQRLRGPIFKRYYGITVNIQPTRLMNKRQWKLYSHQQQIAQLTRIEAFLRRKTPSIELLEIHYEECPILKQMHFHALYRMPIHYIHELQTYFNDMLGTIVTKTTKTDQDSEWKHLDIIRIHQNKDWIQYIRKDLKT